MLTPERFEELYREFWGRTYAQCWMLLGEREAAEDAAMEVFLRKWRARARYDLKRGSFASWLGSNTVRSCVDRLRQQRREAALRAQMPVEEPGRSSWGVDMVLERCWEALPAQQRELVLLREVLELTWEEIAAFTGCSVGVVRRQVKTVLSRLGRCLEEAEGEG